MGEAFNFFQVNKVYGNLFFQFPKVLLYGEKYKKLSDAAKLAYIVLKERLEYSIKNNWVDEHGNVYFIFTINELKSLFNCSNDKVIKIKHELEDTNLLLQKRIGLNRPNHLYLADLEVDASDVYLISKINQNNEQTLATSGIPKNRNNLDKDLKNIETRRYNLDTQQLDFSASNYSKIEIAKQNHDLLSNAADFFTDPDTGQIFLEPQAVQLLTFWCQTPQQLRRFIQIILNAKYDTEKQYRDLNVHIGLDNDTLRPLMTKTLRRYFNVLRSDEKHVQDVENYLYGTMKNLFEIYWNKQAAEDSNWNLPNDAKQE